MARKMMLAAALAAMTTGCATMMTPTVERETTYTIYQVSPSPGMSAAQLAQAIQGALQRNTDNVQVTRGIPASPLPTQSPRFQVGNAFQGTNLAALAAMSGQSMQMVTCDGSLLYAQARDERVAEYGEGTTFTLCLWQYEGGFHVDVVREFVKSSGSFSAATLGATLARTVVGDSSQFTPRMMDDLVTSMEKAGATVTVVESYP